MNLTLRIKDEEKTFTPPFISGRKFREALVIAKKLDGGFSDPKELDEIIDFVVNLYGKQFTRDEFYDGIEGNKVITTVLDCLSGISGQSNKAMGEENDPNE